MKTKTARSLLRIAANIAAAIIVLTSAAAGVAAQPQGFASPEEAVAALIDAVDTKDERRLHAMFGSDAEELLSSGDSVEDARNREKFAAAYHQDHKIVMESPDKAVLQIGADEWPLPIPLVKQGSRWQFDAAAGKDEILKRRIGRNELAAMRVCLAIVAAEHEYATHRLDRDGVPVYSAHIVSSAGKLDGLYWPASASEEPSPLGALLAAAADEGYQRHSLAPYHGYYYRILTRQGKNAPGGERDYITAGKLLGGFAVFAYPARHGASGVKSFLVNAEGDVYSKDLDGKPNASISAFDPDDSWLREAQPDP